MNKRIISLVLALVMVLGTFSFTFAEEPENGLTDNEKVNWLIQEGLVEGDEGTGDLRLADPIKRSEVAKMVVLAQGKGELAKSLETVERFPDVLTSPADKWANGYINVAAADGIVTGYEDGTFRPGNNITKAEAIAMMVRVAGGLSPEEQKLAVGKNWAAPYLIKAHELGILEGVELGNANEAATREFVFELVYNTLQISETGRYNILKGIVLENYRVESLDKDEIVIEVIREVQRAKYAEKSRAEKGDQIKLVVPAKVADVENLLGKVADFTINEKDEVVRVKIDDSYEYVQGAIEATKDRLTVGTKRYTVELDERYEDRDERIFRSYFNNEDFAYRDFYRDEDAANAEFARVTVKNGKVLFIDAFTFDDIAPVADVTEKGEVLYFDDNKDGEVDELDEADYVLVYEDGELGFGKYEDIAVNDVLHWFVNNKELTVVVRPEADNIVEGEYEEAYAAKAREKASLYVVIEGESYPAVLRDYRKPVYSYTMEIDDFFALTKDYDLDLERFEETDVIALRDMFGNVQLIGTDIRGDFFYAVVTNTSRARGEMRLLRADGEQDWYETDRNTEFTGDEITKNQTQDEQFDKFERNDFVTVEADGNLITAIDRHIVKADKVVKINKDVIELEHEDEDENEVDNYYYYMSKNAILFVNYSKVMDIATFLEDYVTPADKEYKDLKKELKAEVVVVSNRDDEVARIIVIEDATEKDGGTKELVVKVRDVRFTGGKYRLDVTYGDGTTGRHYVASALNEDIRDVERGDFLILTVTKDDDEIVVDFEEVVFDVEYREVYNYRRGTDKREDFVEFTEGEPLRVLISRDAHVFGKPRKGDYVSYRYSDKDHSVVDIIAVVAKPEEEEEVKSDGVLAFDFTVGDGVIRVNVDDELTHTLLEKKL